MAQCLFGKELFKWGIVALNQNRCLKAKYLIANRKYEVSGRHAHQEYLRPQTSFLSIAYVELYNRCGVIYNSLRWG